MYSNHFNICDMVVTGRWKNRTMKNFDQNGFKSGERTFGWKFEKEQTILYLFPTLRFCQRMYSSHYLTLPLWNDCSICLYLLFSTLLNFSVIVPIELFKPFGGNKFSCFKLEYSYIYYQVIINSFTYIWLYQLWDVNNISVTWEI